MPNEDTDVWCDGDLRPDMPMVSGRLLLMQDLRNRLETAPGTLAWDPLGKDYGYDLRALVNTKQRDLKGITGRIVAEVQKDDRVDAAQCDAKWLSDSQIQIDITVDDGDGPFDFTLNVSALTVDLILQGP
jgi:hypothetical protein